MLLIECLVYMALLVVVLNLAFAAYNRCAENSKRLNQQCGRRGPRLAGGRALAG
jgi:type II secretory pathway component PulJ